MLDSLRISGGARHVVFAAGAFGRPRKVLQVILCDYIRNKNRFTL